MHLHILKMKEIQKFNNLYQSPGESDKIFIIRT